jgi:hypothetical protein
MHLSAAANLLAPAYLSLLAKGYSVRDENGLMVAERGPDCFLAENPIELLGVIAIAETRGENWQATDDEIDDFILRFRR